MQSATPRVTTFRPRRLLPVLVLSASALVLGACGSATPGGISPSSAPPAAVTEAPNAEKDRSQGSSDASSTTQSASAPVQGGHDHEMDGGPAPAGMVPVRAPKYPIGSTVTLRADHMPGMDGATARVAGAFDTTTYSISYTPVGGGARVTNHKWVVQEEISGPDPKPFPDGTEVTVHADHMPGMDGATATVDASTRETVYIVDVDMPGHAMKNHKWVTESEMSPA